MPLARYVALAVLVAGCSGSVGVTPPPLRSSAPPQTPLSTQPTPSQSESAPSPADSREGVRSGPPTASLSVEGGDATAGELGTYVWGDSGSDSPWLRGARMAAGSGEPLTVRFSPPIAVASWQARYVRASADGPTGARLLGEGSGDPRFDAPQAGTWAVEVHVTFAKDAGNASYFWQLAVD